MVLGPRLNLEGSHIQPGFPDGRGAMLTMKN